MKIITVLNFLFYTVIVSIIGYCCYYLSVLFMYALLFTAADAPPGDVSNPGRLFFIAIDAIGILFALLIYTLVHWTIAFFLNIPFPMRAVLILNSFVICVVMGALILKFIVIDGNFL